MDQESAGCEECRERRTGLVLQSVQAFTSLRHLVTTLSAMPLPELQMKLPGPPP